jgi:hypothetical protein
MAKEIQPDLGLQKIRDSHAYLRRLAETGVGVVDPRQVPHASFTCCGFGPDHALRKFKAMSAAQGLSPES